MTARTPLVCFVILTALSSVLIFNAASASAGICNDCGPAISVAMSGPYYVNQGDTATYDYTVSNPGNRDLVSVTLSDTRCDPISAPTGDDGNDGVLSVGELWTYTCTANITDAPGTRIDHVAHAEAFPAPLDGESPAVNSDDYLTTTVTALHLVKTVDKATADPFDQLNYTITVSNDGPEDVGYSFYLADEGCTDLSSDSESSKGGFWVLPGERIVFTCDHVFDPNGDDGSSYTNTACANAYPEQLGEVVFALSQSQRQLTVCDDATTTLAKHSVSGTVFEDLNGDGARQAGEPPLAGIVVYADVNNNGVRDEGEPSSTSDSQGNYSVSVGLGSTTIREDVPGGVTCSFPSGCAYTVDLPKNSPPAPPVLSRPIAARADDPTAKDFGDWRAATVSGTVVGDGNGNGKRDVGESGLSGVLVYADLNGNGTADQGEPSTSSGADGSYTIGSLKPGGYVIRQVLPSGRTCTAPAGCKHSVGLVSNATAANEDFYDAPPAQLVLPARIAPGAARLAGRTGCVSGSGFDARVRGRSMSRVIFFVDGQAVKAIVLPKDRTTYRYRVDVRKLRVGRHLLEAKVVFRSASRTKSKTLRMTFQRCAAQVQGPSFTG